ncbi:MAG TPA: hypothetical protein VII33_05910 [Nakamurella sp.]
MTSHDDVPYADPESLSELIAECRCVEGECSAHGMDLHLARHRDASPFPPPIMIGEQARHLVDGYPDYGG